jgi:hypothetical protein
MSIKIQRIQSEEAGPFDANSGRNRAHIVVPSSVGFSDLENSNIVFRMQMNITNNGHSTLIPAYIAQPHSEKDGDQFVDSPVRIGGAQALIRDGRATSSEFGLLSEQRDQNVISANLDHFTDYWACHGIKEAYNGGGAMPSQYPANPSKIVDSPFLRPARPESVGEQVSNDSQLIEAEVRCPLKHVDRIADGNRQFPNLACGDITYRINLEDVRPVCALANGIVFDEFDDPTPSGNEIGTDAAPLLYVYAAKNTTPIENGAVTEVNKDMCPFYIGMPVEVNYKVGGVAQTAAIRKITKLNITGNRIEIVVDTAIPATGAVTDCEVGLYVDDAATVNYQINDMFLELHTLNLTPQQTEAASRALKSLQIPYLEHRLIKKVLVSTADYAESLHVDAGCSNIAVLTPFNNRLVSAYDNAREYRWSVDGNYTTNRSIQIGPNTSDTGAGVANSVHKHFLQKYFGNIGKQLYSFEDVWEDYNKTLHGDDMESDNHAMYPLVMPMMANDAIINFQLRSENANMVTKEIFFLMSYPRTLNFSNGRLVR